MKSFNEEKKKELLQNLESKQKITKKMQEMSLILIEKETKY